MVGHSSLNSRMTKVTEALKHIYISNLQWFQDQTGERHLDPADHRESDTV